MINFNQKELELIKKCVTLYGGTDPIRYSGNYPTQSTASSVAALVGDRILTAAEELGWPIKLPGFIHDCLEGSFASDFLITAFDEIPKFAEDWPFKQFGLPMSIDMEIGMRGGPFLVGFKRPIGELKFVKDNAIYAEYEGRAKSVDLLFDHMRHVGYIVEISEHNREIKTMSWGGMYEKVASAYNLSMGQKIEMAEGEVIIRKKE